MKTKATKRKKDETTKDMQSWNGKKGQITATTRRGMMQVLVVVALSVSMVAMNVAYGLSPSAKSTSSVSALYVLGDSSVDCGDNTLLYPLIRHNLSLHPCNGSDTTLLPHLLAEKMGLPQTQPFYSQNGSLEGLLSGLNFGSAQATIMNLGGQRHQSLNQQLRQVFETFQLLQLQLSQDNAHHFIKSSIFYLSLGKDDYIDLFLRNASGIMLKYSGQEFARMLVNQMMNVMRNLYGAGVRRIICMGVLPLGCAPRTVWEWRNSTAGDDVGRVDCVGEINELIVAYNTMLEEHVVELKTELPDAQIVFCDVYQGIMEIINNPKHYGFKDVKTACCGLGWFGGMIGCLSIEMACEQASTHVWWDFYNPTHAVNSLLADSAWSGHPLPNICRPTTIRELTYPLTAHLGM
ncbi:hypothetical protein L1049_014287 [Liquidambar formosana]|uniref:Uncharacterized protein n=1 Tax=Liquidambar formosana TaxID=63359 RepID=A0AAP0RML7_LIQFO